MTDCSSLCSGSRKPGKIHWALLVLSIPFFDITCFVIPSAVFSPLVSVQRVCLSAYICMCNVCHKEWSLILYSSCFQFFSVPISVFFVYFFSFCVFLLRFSFSTLSASPHHFLFAQFLFIPVNLYFCLLSLTPALSLLLHTSPPLLPLLSPWFGHNAAFCGIFYYAAALPRWIPSNWGG